MTRPSTNVAASHRVLKVGLAAVLVPTLALASVDRAVAMDPRDAARSAERRAVVAAKRGPHRARTAATSPTALRDLLKADGGTACDNTNGQNCQISAIGGTAGNGRPGPTPGPNPITHAFDDPQTLSGGNGVGAIDFLTRGGNGGGADKHGENGGNGGAGGNVQPVGIVSGVSLGGANTAGIVGLVSQGGSGGGGDGADRGTRGTGGTGGSCPIAWCNSTARTG